MIFYISKREGKSHQHLYVQVVDLSADSATPKWTASRHFGWPTCAVNAEFGHFSQPLTPSTANWP